MSKIIKVLDAEKGFTIVVNHIFRNKELSLKAKGLYCLMWSLPDNWQFSVDGLATLVTDKRDSVRSAMNELEEFYYLIRREQTRERGKLSTADYELYQVPIVPPPLEDFTSTVEDAQLNTKGLSTNNKSFREMEGYVENGEENGVTKVARAKTKPEKHKYGQFKNVLLTDEQLAKLRAHPDIRNADKLIESASLYLESKGDHYKSHYAMMLNWVNMEKDRAAKASSPAPRRREAPIDYD